MVFHRISSLLRRMAHIAIQPKLAKPDRTLVVTGIPRSGTSLFCSLLNEIDGIVCFNEIFWDAGLLPYNLERMRKRLVKGGAVPNKYDIHGQLTTDTMDGARVQEARMRRQSPDVVIGTNSNVPYLFHLERLIGFGCPIVALVRNPTYTIASWGSSRVTRIPEAQVGPPEEERHRRWEDFRFYGSTPVERRAELWNMLATIISDHDDEVRVIRYEDLVADPIGVLENILSPFGVGGVAEPIVLENRNIESRFADMDVTRDAVQRFAPIRSVFGYDS